MAKSYLRVATEMQIHSACCYVMNSALLLSGANIDPVGLLLLKTIEFGNNSLMTF